MESAGPGELSLPDDLVDGEMPSDLSPRETRELPTRPKKKGLTSKFLNQKTNAEKEIEEWAGLNKKNDNLSRMSGQLSDNVTEERMLRSKITDLSKERYKFMAHKDYEKKVFIEKVKKRKKFLNSIRQFSGRRASSSHEYNPSSAGRLSLIDRLDPSKSLDRPKEVLQKEQDSHKQPAKPMMPPIKSNTNPFRKKSIFPTEPEIKERDHLPEVQTRGVTFAADTKPPARTRPAFLPQAKNLLQKIEEKPEPVKEVKPKGKSKPPPTLDPRYRLLENLLCENHFASKPEKVTHIIHRLAALHVPPKQPMEARPKLAHKIHDFMQERGIVF